MSRNTRRPSQIPRQMAFRRMRRMSCWSSLLSLFGCMSELTQPRENNQPSFAGVFPQGITFCSFRLESKFYKWPASSSESRSAPQGSWLKGSRSQHYNIVQSFAISQRFQDWCTAYTKFKDYSGGTVHLTWLQRIWHMRGPNTLECILWLWFAIHPVS